jgi:hypothetical protein
VKTLHGQFEFELQKYLQDGSSVSYFELTQQMANGYVSDRLQEMSCYYSNRMSYQEVAELVERVSGAALLSDQSIWQMVNRKAVAVSEQVEESVKVRLNGERRLPNVNAEVNLYDASIDEVLMFEDGIQVREQKSKRVRRGQQETEFKGEKIEVATRARVNTDVFLLEQASGKFAYLSAMIDDMGSESVSLAQVVQARLIEEYGTWKTLLNVVVIGDGASNIRKRLLEIFGMAVTVILDWYHLCKKVREFMSMIARNKAEKALHLKALLSKLWQGQVSWAVEYLQNQVQPKNAQKLADLVGYLQKHRSEIIDYERRQKAGKTIGSGRVEKAVDQVIGHRQKQKGSSWRAQGSKSLDILKILELNGQWQQSWFADEVA